MVDRKIVFNVCTICHKSFSCNSTDNRMMCSGCRVQQRGYRQKRGRSESFILVSGKNERMAG